MADHLKQIDAPKWMLELFKSIDELDALHITQHFVDAVYQYGNAYLMQGRGA